MWPPFLSFSLKEHNVSDSSLSLSFLPRYRLRLPFLLAAALACSVPSYGRANCNIGDHVPALYIQSGSGVAAWHLFADVASFRLVAISPHAATRAHVIPPSVPPSQTDASPEAPPLWLHRVLLPVAPHSVGPYEAILSCSRKESRIYKTKSRVSLNLLLIGNAKLNDGRQLCIAIPWPPEGKGSATEDRKGILQ